MTTPQEYDDLVMRLWATANSAPPSPPTYDEPVGTVVNLPGSMEREAATAITALQFKIIDLQNLLHETRDVLGSERDAAVEALKPFCQQARDTVPDDACVQIVGYDHDDEEYFIANITAGDLRRAASIASKKEEV